MSLLAPFVAALVLVGCASVEQGAQSSSDGDVSSRSPQGTGSTSASSSHEDESRSRRDESSLETRSETSTIGSSAATIQPPASATQPNVSSDATDTRNDTSASQTTNSSGAQTTDTTAVEACANGPLSAPITGCEPEFTETGDYYADCVARINQLRWECQCLPPLERVEDGEDCADKHSKYDYETDQAHAGFRAMICEPGGSGQNECPGYGGRFGIVDFCLQQMWDEGPGEDFQAHGHYLNMTNPDHKGVACGRYTDAAGEIWAVQNFFL